MRIYVAGPYTKGDVAVNVRNAILAGEQVAAMGHIPFIPHLTHFWHLVCPHDVKFWYEQDLVWLRQCEALLRLPGESTGADEEVRLAQELGLPVFRSIERIPALEIR
jgi:hypothetical protein